MDEGRLIICPQHDDSDKKILGSIDADGRFYVKRHARLGGTTIITGHEFTIFCVCGFGTTILNPSGVTTYVRPIS